MSCIRGCCQTQALHYKSVALSAGPTPQSKAERRLTADLSAYRRMRANGLQPPGFTNAALLESNAKISQEVEQGLLFSNARMRREITERSTEMNLSPVTTPTGDDAA